MMDGEENSIDQELKSLNSRMNPKLNKSLFTTNLNKSDLDPDSNDPDLTHSKRVKIPWGYVDRRVKELSKKEPVS